MKRLTGLLIVLAVTLPANAALSLGIDGSGAPSSVELLIGEVLTIQIFEDDTSTAGFIGYIIRDADGVGHLYDLRELWRDPIIVVSDPDIDDPDYGEGFTLAYMSISPDPKPSILWDVKYSSSVVGSATISLYDGRTTPTAYLMVDSLDINVVPEPATIALLALGGLTLIGGRRR